MSLVSRHVGKAPLALTDAELQAGVGKPAGLGSPRLDAGPGGARVPAVCEHVGRRADERDGWTGFAAPADIGELVAFYRGLPLYPDQPRYALRAAEGVRSNMRVVFEAVAHRNPYPAEQLPSRRGISWC